MKKWIALATVFVATNAAAHTNPARRSVALQTRGDSIVLLVEWTVPSGEYGEAYASLATWGRSNTADARRSLETSLAAKALGPLEIKLDGAPLDARTRIKLTEDPPKSERLAVAVLLEAALPAGEHRLSVGLSPAAVELTRFVWVDHDGAPSLLDPAHPFETTLSR